MAAFKNVPNTTVIVRDEEWVRGQNMNLFLSVAQGSDQPLKFVEIHYQGAPEKDAAPLALVGKGITFDSGGISLKPGAGMELMRADMGGAAAVVASTLAIAQLGLPINVSTVTPLTENMPSGRATKPGDIFEARNGLTVQIDNTDAEGRLVLADAISYATDSFKPHTLIDVATLTGACVIALGDLYSAVFTEADALWQELKVASEAEHDLCWRMPLTDSFLPQISKTNADLVNTGGRPAGACTAAVFLKQFVTGLEDRTKGEAPSVRYAHIDIAGSMVGPSTYPGSRGEHDERLPGQRTYGPPRACFDRVCPALGLPIVSSYGRRERMLALVALPSSSSSAMTFPVPRLLWIPHTAWPAATYSPLAASPPRIGAAVRGESGR